MITWCNIAAPSNGVTEKPEGQDKNGRLYDKAGKVRKIRHEQKEADGEGNARSDSLPTILCLLYDLLIHFNFTSCAIFLGLGVNIRSIVIVTVLMILMMFAVHCTWVTSNAYSSPSIVLASYRPDGYILH